MRGSFVPSRRKMLRHDGSFACHDYRALQYIAKLADISGPRRALEFVEHGRVNRSDVTPMLLIEIGKNGFADRGDVISAVAQGRQRDAKNIQAIIQILAQLLILNGLLRRSI